MTTSTHRPTILHDGDRVVFRLTAPDGYRVPFTFVEALNEGTLVDRSGRVFESAAQQNSLYEVVVGPDERIVGTGMFQETFRDAAGGHHEEELGGLMVHPGARGFGIMGLLVKLMMIHRFAVLLPREADEDDIAHVVDGNRGPIDGLVAAGFVPIGEMQMHAGEFDGALGHMMQPGENFVRLHAYRFDPAAIDCLIRELQDFKRNGGMLVRSDLGVRLPVDFSRLVDLR
jgi:hypothetical protein